MKITLDEAVALIMRGEVVSLPTETVYGLGALLDQGEKIYEIKKRPEEKRFSIAIATRKQMNLFEPIISKEFEALAHKYWPGPLTLIAPTNQGTTAFRIPDHPLTLKVLRQTGPLLLTSANLSGKKSAISANEVEAYFGEEFPVFDGGSCRCAKESTILEWTEMGWKVIRQGFLNLDDFV